MAKRLRRGAAAAFGVGLALGGFALGGAAQAQPLSGRALAAALQHGGYVLVIRHASSPDAPPSPAEADRDNPNRERQLDAKGRDQAQAVGAAIRRLHIRIGTVWSSPTYRARETVRLAGLPEPRTAEQLGDRGQSMRAVGGGQGAWLRALVARAPRPGTDTLIVTQQPNIEAAFGPAAAGMGAGDALVFHPAPRRAPELAGRINIDAWPGLANQSK